MEMVKDMKIVKEMTMTEIMDIHESLSKVLESFGLDCLNCLGSEMGTLEEAALGHDLKLQELLEALNRELKKHV